MTHKYKRIDLVTTLYYTGLHQPKNFFKKLPQSDESNLVILCQIKFEIYHQEKIHTIEAKINGLLVCLKADFNMQNFD